MPKDSRSLLFFIDRGQGRNEGPHLQQGNDNGVGDAGAAWSDDEGPTFNGKTQLPSLKPIASQKMQSAEKLRKSRNTLLFEKPAWARKVSSQDEGTALDPLRIVDVSKCTLRPSLLPNHIGIRRYKSLNTTCKSPVTCLQFHPSRPWLLVGRNDGSLSVSEIGTSGNNPLSLCKVPRTSVLAARYTGEGAKVLLCSSRAGILLWDPEKRTLEPLPRYSAEHQPSWVNLEVSACSKYAALFGKDGRVALLSGPSLTTLGEFKMNGSALCGVFDSQRQLLLTAGSEHKIYIWSLASLKCVKVLHIDSGCTITSLTISPDAAHLLVGTELGILGLCSYEAILSTQSTSMQLGKLFMNLTTRIHCARVHPSSELFCFSSPDRARALRMVHLRSLRVFSNWPKDITPLHKVRDVAFDASGHYMAIGNEKGNVLIYGLSHFQ